MRNFWRVLAVLAVLVPIPSLAQIPGGGGGGSGSSGAVFGPTAVGSAAANPPVLMGGTANGAATGNVAVAEIKTASSAVVGDPAVVVSDPVVASALNNAPPVNVNGTPTGVTGTTPGGSRTGTIIAQDMNIAGQAGAVLPKGGLGVVNGGNTYQLFAASTGPTVFTGGGGGALGDYLSHCTVIPTTTSPGVVTILDSTTAIYSFPGGASSLSNLVPFAIPVGANSKIGAWNVTLGAGVSMVCEGKPT